MQQIWKHPLTAEVPVDLRHIVPGFLERREKEIGELTHMVNVMDFTSIREIAHKLKGSGGGYGFQIISDIARELEMAAKEEDSRLTRQTIEKLSTTVTSIKKVLQG